MSDSLTKRLERFYARQRFGIKPGLDRISALLKRLGNPERALTCIHVAGTNGKGSVCAMLAGVIQKAGLSTGLYTSPHLVRFNERIRLNGEDIPDGELDPLAVEVEGAAFSVETDTGDSPTFFEVSTALAFAYFADKKPDLVILETGMGGRLDATNVVQPAVSVITGISLEHAQYLGSTIAEIAREKAGIIKPCKPVVCGRLPPEAMVVVEAMAAALHARVYRAGEWVSVSRTGKTMLPLKVRLETGNAAYGTVTCPLTGLHQIENLQVVLTTLECLQEQGILNLDSTTLRRGLEIVRWRGRMEMLAQNPVLMVDGAHNPEAAGALVKTLHAIFGRQPVGLVMGMCQDKDARSFADTIRSCVGAVWLVPISTERSTDPESLRDRVGVFPGPVAIGPLMESLEAARQWALKNQAPVVVAGSLFLVGEVINAWDHGCIPWGRKTR